MAANQKDFHNWLTQHLKEQRAAFKPRHPGDFVFVDHPEDMRGWQMVDVVITEQWWEAPRPPREVLHLLEMKEAVQAPQNLAAP